MGFVFLWAAFSITVAVAAVNAKAEDRIKISGDLRARLHHETSEKNEKTTPATGATEDFKPRVRARLAVNGKVTEELSANIRLSTGSASQYKNNRFSNADFSRFGSLKVFELNLAYLDYHPTSEIDVQFGKHPNPFWRAGFSPLNYFYDQTFEGGVVKWSSEMNSYRPFVTLAWTNWMDRVDNAGNVPNSQNEGADVGMFSGQLGTKWKSETLEVAAAVAYYHNFGIKGLLVSAVNQTAAGAPSNPGNSEEGTAPTTTFKYNYHILNPGVEVTYLTGFMPVTVYMDYAANQDTTDRNTGYIAGINVGRLTEPGTWMVGISYREVGLDAVLAQVADGGFAGGPTDTRGYELSAGYQIAQSTKIEVYYDKAKGSLSTLDYNCELLLIDLVASF